MAITDEQYYPMSSMGNVDDPTMSTRTLDLSHSINSAKYRATNPVLIQGNPFPGGVKSVASGTDEEVIAIWGPYTVVAYNQLTWSLSAKSDHAAEANAVTWRMYSGWDYWKDGAKVSAANLAKFPPYFSGSQATSKTTVDNYTNTISLYPNRDRQVYLMLTAQNTVTARRGTVYSVSATATKV